MAKISLIVPVSPNSNEADLRALLRTIETQTLRDLEVLLVLEEGRNLSLGLDSRVRTCSLRGVKGASAARNYAAALSKSRILGFLDDDVLLESTWAELAVETFNDESVGGASGMACVPLHRYHMDYIPTELLWVVGGCYWASTDIVTVGSAAGMNFCVRKMSFVEVGGYDVSLGPSGDRPEIDNWFRLGAEEDDLAYRIQNTCGKKIVYNPRMRVDHKLRRETVLLRGVVKRALHVGHNRAYIHSRYPSGGISSDSQVLQSLMRSTATTIMKIPFEPIRCWKKLSFTSIVVGILCVGYMFGSLRFRQNGSPRSKSDDSVKTRLAQRVIEHNLLKMRITW